MTLMHPHLNRPLTDGRAVCFDQFGPDEMPIVGTQPPAFHNAAAMNFNERRKNRTTCLVAVANVSQVRPTGLAIGGKAFAAVKRDRVKVGLEFHPAITPYGVIDRQH